MRLLIVGASGFIGKHLFAQAKDSGIVSLGTHYRNHQQGLVSFNLLSDSIEKVVPSSFFNANDIVYGIICSYITSIDKCFSKREISHKINVENTIRLIDEFKRLDIVPVFLSSDYVYDGKRGYYDETIPPCPITEYGCQKAEIEKYMQSNSSNGMVIRLSMTIGSDPGESHLLSQWYGWLEQGKPIMCIEGQIFSPTYVNDVAYGIITACKENLKGLYNVTNNEFFSGEELARQFIIALGIKGEVLIKNSSEFNFMECRPLKTYLDSTKFRKAVNIQFTSVREVFEFFATKVNNKSN